MPVCLAWIARAAIQPITGSRDTTALTRASQMRVGAELIMAAPHAAIVIRRHCDRRRAQLATREILKEAVMEGARAEEAIDIEKQLPMVMQEVVCDLLSANCEDRSRSIRRQGLVSVLDHSRHS